MFLKIIRGIKPSWTVWTVHVFVLYCIGDEKLNMVCRFRNLKESDQLEDLLVDGWII